MSDSSKSQMGKIIKLAKFDFLKVFRNLKRIKKQSPDNEETAKMSSREEPSSRDLVVEMIVILLSQLPRKNVRRSEKERRFISPIIV